ncbi:hypothetical protein MHYP_G00119280 [Metynnis hypsauchen]
MQLKVIFLEGNQAGNTLLTLSQMPSNRCNFLPFSCSSKGRIVRWVDATCRGRARGRPIKSRMTGAPSKASEFMNDWDHSTDTWTDAASFSSRPQHQLMHGATEFSQDNVCMITRKEKEWFQPYLQEIAFDEIALLGLSMKAMAGPLCSLARSLSAWPTLDPGAGPLAGTQKVGWQRWVGYPPATRSGICSSIMLVCRYVRQGTPLPQWRQLGLDALPGYGRWSHFPTELISSRGDMERSWGLCCGMHRDPVRPCFIFSLMSFLQLSKRVHQV